MKGALAAARQWGGCAKGQLFQWMPVTPGTTATATTMRLGSLGQNGNHFKLNVVHNLTTKYQNIKEFIHTDELFQN